MYSELYAAWQREVENASLQPLSTDFFVRVSDYLRMIKEETRMIDKKTTKASLLEDEMRNVKHIINELIWTRYKKLLKMISKNQKIPSDLLTAEEAKIYASFLSFTETYRDFAKSLLQGNPLKIKAEKPHKRVTLRFKKAIPAVIGADMKLYGPFTVEDVASLPVENAKLLVKQGLAEIVDVS
jgi:DNA replication initiation complex subunit (GINS family)